jgi:HEPN domain-containing protein
MIPQSGYLQMVTVIIIPLPLSLFSFTSESYYYMIIPMNGVKKTTEEWLKQADYDLETAEAMLLARKYIYAIFMCHLAVEKTLKALWTKKYSETPGKTHDLIFLSSGLELNLTTKFNDFLEELNGLSVPTRYPDELGKVLKQFSLAKTKTVYKSTKELLSWLKN